MCKCLFVDSYDSYTYNVHQLILDVVPAAEIIIVRNDQFQRSEIGSLVQAFDFIVIGPGPGDPRNGEDVGFIPCLFDHNVPILGVCLGFQLICLRYGGTIERLHTVKHGQVSEIRTETCAIYPSGEPLRVTRYHSIGAAISGCEDLREIAWTEDVDNGHVSMSVMHKSLPFVGVQYHPESACSHGGASLMHNFLRLADEWNRQNRSAPRGSLPDRLRSQSIKPTPFVSKSCDSRMRAVEWCELNFVLSATRIAEILGVDRNDEFIFLDAAAEPSRYSIIAAISTEDKHLQYHVGSETWRYGGVDYTPSTNARDVWQFIATIMASSKFEVGPPESSFWGGLTGYVTYESGVESLGIKVLDPSSLASDISMVFVERSLVIDHKLGKIYVQSIKRDLHDHIESDSSWIEQIRLELSSAIQTPPATPPPGLRHRSIEVELPDKDEYLHKIAAAQQFLAEGQSYELCLTAPTKITCEAQSPWSLYQTLRRRNPSPFACYMRLPGVHLLSSSPERFLSWSRDGLCQLRPIKGTVRKTSDMTYERASKILNDPKEIAENLMIVDLIRHDLHQIAKHVRVPSLMQVEEYETVFQLVSVITGQVEKPYTGFDVLSRSLPPGSMTGAPKKRSVELLQVLEARKRGIYSGVCGYLSVCGAGDWSVIIRSAFRYDKENNTSGESGSETWWIGAGGAITALSDPEAEWDEMLTKLQSTLPCFAVSTAPKSTIK